MSLDFFSQGLWVDAAAYIELLESVVRPLIDSLSEQTMNAPTKICSFTKSGDDTRLGGREFP